MTPLRSLFVDITTAAGGQRIPLARPIGIAERAGMGSHPAALKCKGRGSRAPALHHPVMSFEVGIPFEGPCVTAATRDPTRC